MTKRIWLLTISILLLLMFSGCNLKEKISENIAEEILEQAVGEGTEIDIDGEDVSVSSDEGEFTIDSDEGMTYEGEDGTVVSSGSEYEWPTDQAGAELPEMDAGVIVYVLNSPDACMLNIEDVVLEDYTEYKETVIDSGYTDDKLDSSAEDLEVYSGTLDGATITLSFVPSEEVMSITIDTSNKTE